MANWTPPGFIGQLFKTIGNYVRLPAGVNSPAARGTRAFIEREFAHATSSAETGSRMFNFRFQSAQHWLDLSRTCYVPVHKAFAALGGNRAQQPAQGILNLIEAYDKAGEGTMLVSSEYLEIVITRA